MPRTLNEVEKKNSYCAQCGSCCPIICHVKDGLLVKVEADRLHPNAAAICPKGAAGPELVHSGERLKYPMQRTRPKGDIDPGWRRITWDEAFDVIGTKLGEAKARFGAESVAFCRAGTGGSPFTDLSAWVARLSRAFGSPNLVTTTHVCQWHRDNCSSYTYGQGGIGVPEFERAAGILVWGHNPHATSRVRVRDIKVGRERGARLVVIDPRRTELAAQADIWLQLKPGTDGALALGIMRVMLDERLYDEQFCRDWTNGPFLVRSDNGNLLTPADVSDGGDARGNMVWDTGSNHVKAYDAAARGYEAPQVLPGLEGSYKIKLRGERETECRPAFQLLKDAVAPYSPPAVEAITGVPGEMMVKAARLLATTKPLCYFSYNGIEQQTNASQTNRALCILYTLTGNYGIPGGNVVYPRLANPVDGLEFVTAEMQQKRLGFRERPLGPARRESVRAGDLYQAILSGKPYPVKALVGFGGNPITANAESLTGREALKRLDFYVQMELFLTPAAELADIVLPAATFLESQSLRVSFHESARAYWHIQLSSPVVTRQHESRPDLEVMFELAQKLGLGDRFWHGSIPAAYDYMLAPSGVTRQQLEQDPRGISLNRSPEYQKYRKVDTRTGNPQGVSTPSGKIEIYSQVFKDCGYEPLPAWKEAELRPSREYPFTLICAKVLQFCHGQHRALPSLRKAVPYPFLEINPTKAGGLGIHDGEWVILESPRGSIRVKARLTPKIAPDVVCTQHGWWQSCPELDLPGFDPYSPEGSNVNLVYSDEPADPLSGSLLYKGYPCNVRRP